MKVTTERQENCIVQLSISVDERAEQDYLRRATRALSRNYRLPGYRPGKAPYNVVVRRLGIEAVRAQVIEDFGDKIFEEGLAESQLEPVDQASLEDVTWEPLTLHLKVPVGPEVYLGAYRDIRVSKQEVQTTDEDLEGELLRLQKERSEWQAAERPAEIGDQVVLDITGKVDGEVVLENKSREMVLDDKSSYPVVGFAEAIVGMATGETREFGLTYPEDHYNADIAGKEGRFEARLEEIRTQTLPPLDDEFAMSIGDYEGLEDLRAKLSQSLLEGAQAQADQEFQDQIWEKLLEIAQIEYPETYVNRELEGMQRQLEAQLKQQGLDIATYFQLTNTTEEGWRAQLRPTAEERLKRGLILNQVTREEGLEVGTEEIEARIEEMLEPMGDQADAARKAYASAIGKAVVADDLLREKATERLEAIVRGEAPELAAEDKGAGEPAGAGDEAEAALPETEPDAPPTGQDESPEESKEKEPAEDAACDVAAEAEIATPEVEAPEIEAPEAEVEVETPATEQDEGTPAEPEATTA